MALQIEYLSRGASRSKNSQEYYERLVGTEIEIDDYVSTLKFNVYVNGKGYLNRYEKTHKGGDLWNLAITFSTSYDESGESETGDKNQPQMSELRGTVMQTPIEGHPDYRMYWSYYLIGLGEAAKVVPEWFFTAKDAFIPTQDAIKYRWVKKPSEIPLPEPDKELWQICHSEEAMCVPVLPGVYYRDVSTYVIREQGEYSSKDKAGWAVSNALNTIFDKPQTGDFNINKNGDWKVDNVSVTFNGRKWVAELEYVQSGDASGWNRYLYPQNEASK